MMPEEIASGWPVRSPRTLANLQDRHRNAQPRGKRDDTEKNGQGGQPVGPIFQSRTR